MLRYLKRGFTLPELLTTLAVVAILTTLGLPALTRLVTASEQSQLVTQYRIAFAFARSQAITYKHPVTVCPVSDDTHQCIDDWSKSAAIFPDADNDKSPDDGVVWRLVSPTSSYRIRSRTGGRGAITFGPTGMTHGASGSLVACPAQSDRLPMSYLAVNRGGRFRVQHDDNLDSQMRLSWGAIITCP